ncbi:TPA: hypothetical protein N2D99_002472 [Clostridium botulinum]|nr:hypothetical protein [Clostridium botulinum]
MLKIITNYLKNKTIERRRKSVSKVSLKEVILRSKKNEVISFALEYITKENYCESIRELINSSGNYICPISDKRYLSKIYDEIYFLSQKEYNNETVENYEIRKGFGFPFGFDEFIDVVYTNENLEATENFVYIDDNINKIFPIEFMINCKLNKYFLKHNMTEIVALTLLQVIYIQELNKK